MNDISNNINWKRITRSLPKVRNVANDRPYSVSELQTLLKYANRRLRVIILTACSCGFRLAAWDYLKWGHITPIEQDGKLVAAKIRVYADDPEEYYSFITPEAYNAIKDWMDYRAFHKEQISDESWVMRDLWRTSDVKIGVGGRFGLATIPNNIKSEAVKRSLERALFAQGLRKKLPKGVRRYEVKVDHGLRKFCNTRLHEVLDDTKVKNLMGQKTGISDHYNRPDENKLLAEYLKAVPLLTINGNNNDNDDNQKSALAEQTSSLKEELERLKKQVNIQDKNWTRFVKYITPRLKLGETVSLLWPDGDGKREFTIERVDENDPFNTAKIFNEAKMIMENERKKSKT